MVSGREGRAGRGGRMWRVRGAESPGLSPPASGTEARSRGGGPVSASSGQALDRLGGCRRERRALGPAAPAPGTARLRDPSPIAPGAGVVVVASARERRV